MRMCRQLRTFRRFLQTSTVPFPVLVTAVLLCVLPLFNPTALANSDSYVQLVSGLSQIGMPDGVCGPLRALSDKPVSIVLGDDDSYSSVPDTVDHYEPGEYPPIAMATTYGNGRVVAICQEGFFIERNINRYDNLLLGLNSIEWLDKSGNRRILYDDRSYPPLGAGPEEWGVYSGLGKNLLARGYLVDRFPVQSPVTEAVLAHYDVYMVCTSWDAFSPSEISSIVAFVSNGGGLFLTGLGWSWVQYEGPLNEYPMNEIAAPFGIAFMDGYVCDPSDCIGDEFHPVFHTFYIPPRPCSPGNWLLANYGQCNTRCTSSPGPTPRSGEVEKSWAWRAEDFYEEDSGDGSVFWRMLGASAPLIDDERVFVFTYGLASSFFRDVIEAVSNALRPFDPLPLPPSIDVHASKLYCVDRHDGALLWSKPYPGRIVSIALDQDFVYVAIKSDWTAWDEIYVGGVAALSKTDGEREWENRDFEPQGSIVVQGNNVLVSLCPRSVGTVAGEPQLCCLDSANNGTVKWAYDFSSLYGGPAEACDIAATPTGQVLLSSIHGLPRSLAVLSCIQGSDSAGTELWHREFPNPISYPIVDGDTVFVEDGAVLYGFSIKQDGEETFRFEEEDLLTPAIGRGKIVFMTEPSLPFNNMHLYCIDRLGQEPPKEIEIPYSLSGGVWPPVIADESVIVSRRGGPQGTELLCFQLNDLTLKWSARIPWVGDLTQIAETIRVAGEQVFATYHGAPGFQDILVLCIE
jgi:outer membrane protein assembly factor BamB